MKLFYRKIKWLLFSRETIEYRGVAFPFIKGSNGTHYAASGARVKCIDCRFKQ